MRRREFITLIGGSTTWPLVASAQQSGKVKRVVGVLMGATNDAQGRVHTKLFEDSLRGLGWISGENIRIEYRWAAGDRNLARSHAAELGAMNPDVILGDGTPVALALRDAATTIPIVFVQVSDPIGSGLVSSLARPGGNVTGFTNFEFSIGGKWIDTIREIKPAVKRIFVLYNPQTAPHGGYVKAINEAAAIAKVVVEVAEVADPTGIENVVSSLSPTDDALIVLPDIFTFTNGKFIIARVAERRVVTIYPFPFFATSGGLISYGIDQHDLFVRSASYVDRILRGERPSALPVQLPTKFRLLVNLKSAAAQEILLPPTLLARADEVIE
jgi:putative ABC transport system substrate-binding protein